MTGDRKPFPLIETAFNEGQAVFSPSGRFIAYVSNDSGVNQVYVQPFPPTGARVQLSSGNGRSPMWTSDGRTVLYSSLIDVILGEGLRRRDRFHGGRRDDVRIDGARRISSNALHATTHWRRHEWLCRRRVRSAFSAGRARSEGVPSNHRLLELAVAVVEEVKPAVSFSGHDMQSAVLAEADASTSSRLPCLLPPTRFRLTAFVSYLSEPRESGG